MNINNKGKKQQIVVEQIQTAAMEKAIAYGRLLGTKCVSFVAFLASLKFIEMSKMIKTKMLFK